jgi:hypothetical protein
MAMGHERGESLEYQGPTFCAPLLREFLRESCEIPDDVSPSLNWKCLDSVLACSVSDWVPCSPTPANRMPRGFCWRGSLSTGGVCIAFISAIH